MIVSLRKLEDLFERLAGLPIAVVGDVMLDRYIWGDTERISPEAPVPVVYVQGESARLGGAANVAWNLKAVGAKPLLFGVIGNDMFAEQFLRLLREHGIAPDFLAIDPHRPTTTKTRIIARGQQMLRIDREDVADVGADTLDRLTEQILSALDDVAGVIISDYGKGVINEALLRRIVPEASRRKIFVAVDPKENHFPLYRGVSVITPNTREAGGAVGMKIKDEASLLEVGRRLKKLTGAKNVLITRGPEGMSLFYSNGRVRHFPTMARQVYDVTGAGDTVVGVFTAVVAAGGTLSEAAIISSHAAGVVVGKVGTAVATPEEITESIKIEIERKRGAESV